jgi:hypothetical protein
MDNGFGSTDEDLETRLPSQPAVRIALQFFNNVSKMCHHSANLIKAPEYFSIPFDMKIYSINHPHEKPFDAT